MKKFLCILLVSIILIASTTTSEALGLLNALTKEPEITYKELKIGDIAKTDYAEVKLIDFQFLKYVYGNHVSNKENITEVTWGPGADNVWVWFKYNIKNISKKTIDSMDMKEFSVDYNDGFIFYDFLLNKYGEESGVASSIQSLPPLKNVTCNGAIQCPTEVKTDKNALLLLKFTLPSSKGKVGFAYVIR